MTDQSLKLVIGKNEIELAYVAQGEVIFLVSSGTESRWPSKILREGKAIIKIDDRTIERRVRLVSERNLKENIMNLMSDKYGKEKTNRWFSSSSRIIELNTVPLNVTNEDIYSIWLEAEFDSIASDYDKHIFGNEVNSLLRERSLSTMSKVFDRPSRLLEIGCGTGTETIELLRRGHNVLATDISQKMLEIVSQKAKNLNLESKLTTIKLNAENIEYLIDIYGRSSFDGIYSTYGAINCIREIGQLPFKLHSLLNSNGKLVMGIYNKLCAIEIGGYLAKLKPFSAFKRLRSTIPEGDSRFCIDIYAYTMQEILKLFNPFFKLEYKEGVPVIILPSNFIKYTRKFNARIEELKKIDSWLGKKWPFSMLGDHFILVMKPLILES